jgi:plasmid maintenance system killer protein
MTGWDVLNNVINALPPIAGVLLLIAAGVLFIVGFSRYGVNFLKYGFKQKEISDLAKKIDELRTEFKSDLTQKIDELHTEFKSDFEVIKVNHFGHLKDFLTELTSILVDKNVINNQDKARLDNKLRGM